jgi:hypothetical protein
MNRASINILPVIKGQVPMLILNEGLTMTIIIDRSYRFLNDQPGKPLNLGPGFQSLNFILDSIN